MDASRRRRLALGAALFAVAASRWLARARVPDDYDSIGFTLALRHFDLARLQPHFPGYPVYVGLGHVVAMLGVPSLAAATLVSSLAAAATAGALFRLGSVAGGRAAGWTALALWAAAWLPWLAGGAALSDGTATAFVALAFAALTYDDAAAPADGADAARAPRLAAVAAGDAARAPRLAAVAAGADAARAPRLAAVAAGAAVALALGTRLSYWPLALSFAVVARRHRRRRFVAVAALAGTLAWLVPFVAVVGPRQLVTLGRTHVTGHFSTWGGSIVTQPDVALRLHAFARGLAFDGLFAHPLALAAAALVLAVVIARRETRATVPWRLVLVVAAPYALWVLLAQNVVEQPRHLLPLVAAACVLLAVAVARRPLAAAALVLLALAPSLPLAAARARTPPAAAQAAAWASGSFPAPNQVAVFGGRSLRFFALASPSLVTRPRTWLSEVDVELERLDVLPPNLYITSEVTIDRTRAPRVGDGPTFCRDARIDRAQPCLTLRRYRIPGL